MPSERYQKNKAAIAAYQQKHRATIAVWKAEHHKAKRTKKIQERGGKCACGSSEALVLTRKDVLICGACIAAEQVSKQPNYHSAKAKKRRARLTPEEIEAARVASREASARYRRAHPDRRSNLKRKRRVAKFNTAFVLSEEAWVALVEITGSVCLCCQKKKKMTQDHILPLTRGGAHELDNIQPLCVSCNSRKSTKDVDYRPAGWLQGIRRSLQTMGLLNDG